MGKPAPSRGPCPCGHWEKVQSDIVRERSRSPKPKTPDALVRYPPRAEIAKADANAESESEPDLPQPIKTVSYEPEKSKIQLLMKRFCCIKCQSRKKIASKGKGWSVAIPATSIRVTMNFSATEGSYDGTESCATALPGSGVPDSRRCCLLSCIIGFVTCSCCRSTQSRMNQNGVVR